MVRLVSDIGLWRFQRAGFEGRRSSNGKPTSQPGTISGTETGTAINRLQADKTKKNQIKLRVRVYRMWYGQV